MARIALITGGNRGLGRAAALSLASDGVDSVITYRSHPEEADAVVAELRERGVRATALPLDVSDVASFASFEDSFRTALAQEFGADRFDILINNAGFDGETPFGQTDAETMDALYAVHVRAPVLLTERLVPDLMNDGGRVLFLSSGLARYVANPAYSVYASMKGAIEVYTRYAARVLGAREITVNVLAPGATATDFAGGRIRDDADYQAMVTRNHAFGRVGEPEDIGEAIRAVVSPSARWITAQRIEASGGQGL